MPTKGVRVRAGLAALPVQTRFCLSLLYKRLFRHRRYPQLLLSPSRGGFLKTLSLVRRIGLTKVVRVGRQYHFSLLEPRWPSEAHDDMIAKGGLNVAAAGTPAKRQIGLAILGITRVCPYRCPHCFERYNLGAEDVVPASRWASVVQEMQEIGVGVVALSGGEPLSRFERTLGLLEAADKRRSDFHLYTAGPGATRERVQALVQAGLAAAGVGLDDVDPSRHDAFRGHRGAFDTALEAIRLFADAGILVFVNVCMTRDLIRSDGLFRLYDLLYGLGVGALQILEPRPCGGLADRDLRAVFGPEEKTAARAFLEAARSSRYRTHPVVYYPALMEAPENLGCMMGGLSHLYIDSLGNVQPCPFLPVAFGNVMRESFTTIFRRLRGAVPRPLHRPCPSLRLSEEIGFRPLPTRPLPIPYEAVEGEWKRLYS